MRIIPVGFPFGDPSLPFDERREREAVPNKKREAVSWRWRPLKGCTKRPNNVA